MCKCLKGKEDKKVEKKVYMSILREVKYIVLKYIIILMVIWLLIIVMLLNCFCVEFGVRYLLKC